MIFNFTWCGKISKRNVGLQEFLNLFLTKPNEHMFYSTIVSELRMSALSYWTYFITIQRIHFITNILTNFENGAEMNLVHILGNQYFRQKFPHFHKKISAQHCWPAGKNLQPCFGAEKSPIYLYIPLFFGFITVLSHNSV